jgi:hypothetical protein
MQAATGFSYVLNALAFSCQALLGQAATTKVQEHVSLPPEAFGLGELHGRVRPL